ncbi:MAG: conjugal transfer protein TraF [candidate division KSB1 bacterium]|nr:conjugal transfer protein TraF [candidate division KSB1 bacterium]
MKNPAYYKVLLLFCIIIFFSSYGASLSQSGGGYIVYNQITAPPLDIKLDPIEFPQSPNRFDVKAMGMGNTQIANGRFFNAMMYNPALLSRQRTSFDVLSIQASLPKATFDAATFLKDNRTEFKQGDFLKLLADGFKEYYSAQTAEQQRLAIQKINRALEFPNQLLDNIVGDTQSPQTHGLNMLPSFQAQIGNWGFSLYGNAQVGFEVEPGETVGKLLALKIPENSEDLTVDVLRELANIVGSLFDESGNISQSTLPQAFAVSYVDIIGAIGRAYAINENLHLGANLKVINRRFSTKRIDADNFKDVLKEARSDIEKSATGFTIDVGALYRYQKTGTEFGVSLQNVLPVKEISSSVKFNFVTPVNAYYVDDGTGKPAVGSLDLLGNFYPDPSGDTLLTIENQPLNVDVPFQLKAPLLMNVGILHPLKPNWDISFDLVDIFSQDDKFDDYVDRFRIGTEYRLPQYRLALRGGLAQRHLAAGLGLDFKYVQLDAAYAHDTFIDRGSMFAQIRFGW